MQIISLDFYKAKQLVFKKNYKSTRINKTPRQNIKDSDQC